LRSQEGYENETLKRISHKIGVRWRSNLLILGGGGDGLKTTQKKKHLKRVEERKPQPKEGGYKGREGKSKKNQLRGVGGKKAIITFNQGFARKETRLEESKRKKTDGFAAKKDSVKRESNQTC